jgi:hypothetical protein
MNDMSSDEFSLSASSLNFGNDHDDEDEDERNDFDLSDHQSSHVEEETSKEDAMKKFRQTKSCDSRSSTTAEIGKILTIAESGS